MRRSPRSSVAALPNESPLLAVHRAGEEEGRLPSAADAGSLLAVGQSLVAIQSWTFLLGPGFVVGIGNGLILGYLMYRSGLVPRSMAMLGLIAGPVLLARFVGILFGAFEPMSVFGSIMVVPEFLWELSLGIWLIVKGFNPSAVASLSASPDDGVSMGVDQTAAIPSNGHPVPSES
jgi:hypothetical protein